MLQAIALVADKHQLFQSNHVDFLKGELVVLVKVEPMGPMLLPCQKVTMPRLTKSLII